MTAHAPVLIVVIPLAIAVLVPLVSLRSAQLARSLVLRLGGFSGL